MASMTPVWKLNETNFKHNKNIPNTFRCLVVGSSGCGKTSLLAKMLLEEDFLDYNNLMIYTTTPEQDLYQLIQHGFSNNLTKDDIVGIINTQNDYMKDDGEPYSISEICEIYSNTIEPNGKITVTITNKPSEMKSPSELNRTKKHLVVFDDCIFERNQTLMESYYTKSRHNNCNCIYLSQSYYKIPKNLIRGNSNLLILFKLSERDRNSIHKDEIETIINKHDFRDLTNEIWNKKYRYVVVNKDEERIIYDTEFI